MPLLRRLAARARALHPVRRDAVLALAIAGAVIAELPSTAEHHDPRWALTLPALALFVAPVAFRTRWPMRCLLLQFGVILAQAAIGGRLVDPFAPIAALGFVMWSVGMRHPVRIAVLAGGTVGALGIGGILLADRRLVVADALWGVIMVVVLPLAGAYLLRSQTAVAEGLAARARALEAERDAEAQRAAQQERERIASELHDVVSHGVAAMVVQASAARALLHARGPTPQTRGAIAGIEETGRSALTELRLLLGVLRRDDDRIALAPQPSLRRIGRLAEALRERGLAVELDAEPVDGLPSGLDVAAFRIVESALEQAAGQGAGHARVAVRRARRALELEVADDAPGDAPEAPGVRERVRLFGGQLALRRRGGERELRVALPLPAGTGSSA